MLMKLSNKIIPASIENQDFIVRGHSISYRKWNPGELLKCMEAKT